MNPWAHWEKMLPGTVILQRDVLDVGGNEEVLSSWLWFGAFSWESRMSPRHWRKAFLFISFPHLSLCQLCNSLFFFFVLLLSIHVLIFGLTFFFPSFWTNYLVRKQWTTKKIFIHSGIQFCISMFFYFCKNMGSLI